METEKKRNLQEIKAQAKMLWYRFLGAIHCLQPLHPGIRIIGRVTDAESAGKVAQGAVAQLSKQRVRQ